MESGAHMLELPTDSSVHCMQVDLETQWMGGKEGLEKGTAWFFSCLSDDSLLKEK